MLIERHHKLFFIYIIFTISLAADLPELSSINPIEYDEVSQRLIASNDAIFTFKDYKLKADLITFYKKYDLLNARGKVSFVSDSNRLLSNDFSLDVKGKNFSINNIKYGAWPYFITARSGGGNEENINLNNGVLYYGEPHPLVPNLKAKKIKILNNDDQKKVIFENALLRIGELPILYLPKIKYDLKNDPYLVDASIGFDSEFGAHIQTLTLFPVFNWLRVGLNLDLYSNRGTLIGPSVQYNNKDINHKVSGAISTGFINDRGIRGNDILNNPINEDRYFLLAQHKQIHENKLFISFQTHDLSDTEVTRDFKESIYNRNQFPLNYFETNYIANNFGVGLYAHFENDDFSKTRERFPEVRFDYFSNSIFESLFFHYGSASFSEIEEASLNSEYFKKIDTLNYSVIDLNYGINSNFTFKDIIKVNPKIEYRGFKYLSDLKSKNIHIKQFNEDYDFLLYGINISSKYQATYPTQNRLWRVNGLRHIFEPSINITRIKSLNEDIFKAFRSNEQNSTFLFSRPSTAFIDYRNLEQINEFFLTRLSLNNFFQTKRPSYGARNIMKLNFFADFYHNYTIRNIEDDISNKNALWIDFQISPAPWLKLEITSRLKSSNANLVENYTKLILKSSMFWELALRKYFKEDYADQVSLDYNYKLNDKTNINTMVWADLKNNSIPRFKLAINNISNANWLTSYSLNYRKDKRRNKDLSFNINLKLISY